MTERTTSERIRAAMSEGIGSDLGVTVRVRDITQLLAEHDDALKEAQMRRSESADFERERDEAVASLDARWENSDHLTAKYYTRMRAAERLAAERLELHTDLQKKYVADTDVLFLARKTAERELQQRELHHFETEHAITEALAEAERVSSSRPHWAVLNRVVNILRDTLHGTPAAPPTDEREALAKLLRELDTQNYGCGADAFLPDADVILAAGFRRQGPITDALRDWIGGEPYEVSCARAGHPVETTPATDPALAFVDGYQRAVQHVAAILEAARDAS